MSKAETRIYLVAELNNGELSETLVRAKSQAAAINHAANIRGFSAALCSADDAIRLATEGVKVTEAGAE